MTPLKILGAIIIVSGLLLLYFSSFSCRSQKNNLASIDLNCLTANSFTALTLLIIGLFLENIAIKQEKKSKKNHSQIPYPAKKENN